MPQFIKTAALALALPGVLATSLPAAAAPLGLQPATLSAVMPADAAHGRRDGWGDRSWRERDYRGDRYRQADYDRDYARAGYPQVWRGDDGRYRCRRADGTTGLLIGGAAGALLGREVAGRRGDRTLGAVLGAAAGALLGREVDRGETRCR